MAFIIAFGFLCFVLAGGVAGLTP